MPALQLPTMRRKSGLPTTAIERPDNPGSSTSTVQRSRSQERSCRSLVPLDQAIRREIAKAEPLGSANWQLSGRCHSGGIRSSEGPIGQFTTSPALRLCLWRHDERAMCLPHHTAGDRPGPVSPATPMRVADHQDGR